MQARQPAELCRRYFFLIVGLFILSFGVALIIQASLGTSPSSSIPYVLHQAWPVVLVFGRKLSISVGYYTDAVNLTLILIQLAVLRKRFRLESLLQIPVSLVFGWFVDFNLWWLSAWNPRFYPLQLLTLLAGCAFLGFGVACQVTADVAMMSAEATTKAISDVSGGEFGSCKIFMDCSLVAVAALISLCSMHRLVGVREGTVIAAMICGVFVKLFRPLLKPVDRRLAGKDTK